MNELQQLKYYVSLGAPPTRTLADGTEPFMRPEVGFNPSWFYKYCDVDFSKQWHNNPKYRLETWEKMAREVRKRFPGYNIGRVNEKKAPDLLTGIYGIGIMDSLFGRQLKYYNDKWPVPMGEKLGDEEIEALTIPNLENNTFLHNIYEQIDEIYKLTGSAKGYLNWQGNLNTAFRFRGDQLFSDFYINPELSKKLLDIISDTFIQAVKLVYKKQREYDIDYSFATIANCTVNMAGPETYEVFLLEYDKKIADNFEMIGVHNCAWTITPYIESYGNIPRVGYIDMGIDSDMKKVKEKFPSARRNCLYTSIDLKNKSKLEIKKDFEYISQNLAPCDVGMPDIEYDVPEEKIMFAMDLCEELNEKM